MTPEMDNESQRIENAALHTQVIRHPRQHLATFGITNIYYYIFSEPSYTELSGDTTETVIREGRVIAERPKIVTPYYLAAPGRVQLRCPAVFRETDDDARS